MNVVERKAKPRFGKLLMLLSIAAWSILGLVFYNGYRSQVARDQEGLRQQEIDADRVATFNSYVESGRLVGMTDQELFALLGEKEPYKHRDGSDVRSWPIITYHKPEMRDALIDFGWRKDLYVESREGRVIRCRIVDSPNG